jgi:hypothetical protein
MKIIHFICLSLLVASAFSQGCSRKPEKIVEVIKKPLEKLAPEAYPVNFTWADVGGTNSPLSETNTSQLTAAPAGHMPAHQPSLIVLRS